MLAGISIFCYALLAGGIFFLDTLAVLSVISLVFFVLLIVLPHQNLRRGVLPISLFLVVTFVANAFFTSGKIIASLGPVNLTEEGFHLASLRTLRVFILIAAAKLLTVMTTLDEMVLIMGRVLRPLDRIGIPVTEFFATMALSVKLLPLLVKRIAGEYARQIHLSGKRGLRAKIEVISLFLLPVFIESIRNPASILQQAEQAEGRRTTTL
ncbi:MAG: CbiQ family ECF transporter T component [bacterium]